MGFDAAIATHPGVVFATTNNSYDRCIRAAGWDGFEALFRPIIARKSHNNWRTFRGAREAALPTCEQAEVLYPGAVAIDHLRRVYVREGDHHDLVTGWLQEFDLPGVEVVLSPEKFAGKPN